VTDRPALRTVASVIAPLPPPRPPTAPTRTFHGLLYLVSALVLAGPWLALVVAGTALSLALAITPLLPAVLIGFAAAVRFCGWIEGYLARRLLGAPTAPRRSGPPRRGYWASVPGVLGNGRFWTTQAFLLLRFVLGIVTGTVTLSFLGSGLFGIAAPLVYRWIPADEGANGIDFEVWKVDTLGEAALLVPVGIALVVVTWLLVRVFAAMWRGLALGLLGRYEGAAHV